MTCKQPLRDAAGKVIGLGGHLARPAERPKSSHPAYSRLAAVVQHIQENYVQPLNHEATGVDGGHVGCAARALLSQGVSSDAAPGVC